MEEQQAKGKGKPIFYRPESWHAPSGPEALKAQFLEAFSDRRYAVKTIDDEIQITTGSKALYKIWGELVPWGQNNAPVGLTLSVQPAPQGGSEVTAAAFDRFGFRWTDKTFFGAEENFTSKMDQLIQAARSASGVSRRPAVNLESVGGKKTWMNGSPKSANAGIAGSFAAAGILLIYSGLFFSWGEWLLGVVLAVQCIVCTIAGVYLHRRFKPRLARKPEEGESPET